MTIRWVQVLAVTLLAFGLLSGWMLWKVASPSLSGSAPAAEDSSAFVARRLPGNPIITHKIDHRLVAEAQRYGYVNVNGPSLIRVPGWVEDRLADYYLYFGHHKGEQIRLAYSNELTGPWSLYGPGALQLADSLFSTEQPGHAGLLRSALDLWEVSTATEFVALAQVGLAAKLAQQQRKERGLLGSEETRPHIASPDVVIDHGRRQFRMYFHGLVKRRLQMTRVAVSSDGIHFDVLPDLISAPYLRLVNHRGMYYGLAMPGLLYRSQDGLTAFQVRQQPLFASNMRHTALWVRGDALYVFYSTVGDAPERILCSIVDISSADWRDWTASRPFEILRPELPWEGVDLPIEPSVRGESPVPVRQLRDPAFFADRGRNYLLYSAAGEQAIAIAELVTP